MKSSSTTYLWLRDGSEATAAAGLTAEPSITLTLRANPFLEMGHDVTVGLRDLDQAKALHASLGASIQTVETFLAGVARAKAELGVLAEPQ
jgi:hypothetical protein